MPELHSLSSDLSGLWIKHRVFTVSNTYIHQITPKNSKNVDVFPCMFDQFNYFYINYNIRYIASKDVTF